MPSRDDPTERYHFGYEEASPYGHAVALVAAHAKRPGEVVIDIGCGFGAIAEQLAERGFTYVGVDLESFGLLDLQRRGFETRELDLRDATAISLVLEEALRNRSLAAVTALDIIEHLTNGPAVLEELSAFCGKHGGGTLVVSIPNVAHIDLGAKLLLGRWDVTPTGLLDETHVSLYAPARLERILIATGWEEVGRADFELVASDQHFPADAAALRPEAPLGDFLRRVRKRAAPAMTTNQFIRAYRPVPRVSGEEVSPSEKAHPFLSVLVSIDRPTLAMLEDLLCSLDAQMCQDFEVLLCACDLEEAARGRLEALVASHSEGLSPKTVVIASSNTAGPGSTTPLRAGVLNEALKKARGRYVAFLDADDVCFGRYVEEFAILVTRAPGAVVRCVGAEQAYSATPWPNGGIGYGAVAGPEMAFAPRFTAVDALNEHRFAPCTYALPMSCFTDLGFRCDEESDIGLEGELFLRAALFCGVEDSTSEVTVLHRRFVNGPRSEASEGRAAKIAQFLASRFDAEPLLLPPGSVSAISGLFASIESLREEVRAMERERDGIVKERDALESQLGRAGSNVVDGGNASANPDDAVELEALRMELDDLRHSTSWKVTAPLRKATGAIRRLRSKGPTKAPIAGDAK